MMTQIQRTINYFATLEKGTILTGSQYREACSQLMKMLRKRGITENLHLSNWSTVIQDPKRFNVERIEIFHKVPTAKITTVDVLEMVKNGCSVEEIEKAVYTTVKEVRIQIR